MSATAVPRLRHSQLRRNRPGVAAVEMAVVSPLLLILVVGVWEVGTTINAYQVLHNACREAAREAAGGIKTAAEVRQTVLDYLEGAGITTAGMPTPVIENLTESTRSEPSDAEQLDHFRVSATLPVANFQWSATSFFTSGTIGASAEFYSMNDRELTVSTSIPTL